LFSPLKRVLRLLLSLVKSIRRFVRPVNLFAARRVRYVRQKVAKRIVGETQGSSVLKMIVDQTDMQMSQEIGRFFDHA